MSSPKLPDDRSYIVQADYDGKLFVKPSHWLPGYTDAYKATKVEAILYYIEEMKTKILDLEALKGEAGTLLGKETYAKARDQEVRL